MPSLFARLALRDMPAEQRIVIRTVVGLGATQVIGWGTSFSTLTIFGTTIGLELGLSREIVFGGITLMLLVSAALAPHFGRLVDRMGARNIMTAGSFVAAAAMLASAVSGGVLSYMLAWVLVGIAMPMMLANAAMPGLVQVVGPNARRAITGLTLISGLTSTVFLPLNNFLMQSIGWRWAYVIFAVLHVVVCAPLHWLVLGQRAYDRQAPISAQQKQAHEGLLKPEGRRRAFWLLAIWSCTEGLITWGLYLQVIDVLKAVGLSGGAAVGVWALVGPSQATARFGELMFGGRHSILTTALASALFSTVSFIAILPFGVSIFNACIFCVSLGIGHGLFAVARNTLPLNLFGAREFGSYMGLLLVPQNIVNAAAPLIFAAVISRLSPEGALWIAGAAAAAGLVAVIYLNAYCRSQSRDV